MSLTTPRLIDVAEQQTALFGDEPVETVPLRETMAHVLANCAPWSDRDRIAAVLMKMSAEGPTAGGSAGIVACFDPQFAATRAQQWGDEAFAWIEDAATSVALFRRDEVVTFLRALTNLSTENRNRILEGVEKFIKRDYAAATAIAKRDRFPPPTRPAPTEDDCRRAIGLG
ncbi:MAG: hypothetical protein JWN44_1208 [Myxococcales bacterium]|nr:hypothetical protein [Myxococcales bacterium]